MRQVQELAQPRPSGLTPLLDFDPVVGTANRAQDRDEEDRFERMEPRRVRTARVLDLSEIEKHVVDGIGGIHGACLAERVDVGETHSTIQDTPIGTAPVDAIALMENPCALETFERFCAFGAFTHLGDVEGIAHIVLYLRWKADIVTFATTDRGKWLWRVRIHG